MDTVKTFLDKSMLDINESYIGYSEHENSTMILTYNGSEFVGTNTKPHKHPQVIKPGVPKFYPYKLSS